MDIYRGPGAEPGSSLRTLVIPQPSDTPPRPRIADFSRHGNTSIDVQPILAVRATTVDPVTCGYVDGDAAHPRTANAGYNCRVDVAHGLWGFCPKSVLYAPDCGLAAACIDRGSCSRGCGLLDEASLTTFTCTGDSPFCSTVLLDSGPDQTYSYIACAATPATATLLAAPTAKASSAQTDRPSTDLSKVISTTTAPAPASRQSHETQPSSSPSSSVSSTTISNTTGAIVGGVVGGIAVICLTILAVVLLVRRGRGRGRADDQASGSAAAGGYSPTSNGPGEVPGTAPEPQPEKSPLYTRATSSTATAPISELGAFQGHSHPVELYGNLR